MSSDMIMSVGLDTTDAKKQLDQFTAHAKKSLAQIKNDIAKAAIPAPRGGSGGGGSSSGSNANAVRNALADQRAMDAALNRQLGMQLRINRQLGDDAAAYRRVSDATAAYTKVIRDHGTRTLEGVKAAGMFQRSMTQMNGDIAKQAGLLATLNKNQASTNAGFTRLASSLAGFAGAGGAVTGIVASLSGVAAATSSASAGASTMGAALTGLAAGAAAVTAGVAIMAAGVWTAAKAMTEASDTIGLLQQRFTVLSGSSFAGKAAFEQLVTTANALGVGLNDAGQAFSRFIMAGKDLGITTQDAGALADTVLKLGRIGGATTQELTGGMIQLGQALASNRLGGDEFRSVMENLPLVARLLAKELGVNIGKLRELASEGKITADVITRALGKAAGDVNAQFAALPRTASAMASEIGNEFTLLLASLDQIFGGSKLVKSVYTFFRDTIKSARDWLTTKPDERVVELEGTIKDRKQRIADRKDSWLGSSPFADQWDNDAIEKAEKELGEIRARQQAETNAKLEEQQVAAQARQESLLAGHKDRVTKIMDSVDPVGKASKTRAEQLKTLKDALDANAISQTEYAKGVEAINKAYAEVQDRGHAAENAAAKKLQSAKDSVTQVIANLNEELDTMEAKLSTLKTSNPDEFFEASAWESATAVLGKFSKSTGHVGESLEDAAKRAGISLSVLLESYKKLEKGKAIYAATQRSEALAAEAAETDKLAAATLQETEALQAANTELLIEREIRELNLKSKDEDIAKIREEITARIQAAEASREYLRAAQEGKSILEEHGTASAKLKMQLDKLANTYRILSDRGEMTDDMAKAFQKAEYEAVASSDTMSGYMIRGMEDVGTALTDSLQRAFVQGKFDAKQLWTDIKSIFAQTMINAFIQPVMTSAMTPVGSKNFGED
jgi:tape measure domain-containing protein